MVRYVHGKRTDIRFAHFLTRDSRSRITHHPGTHRTRMERSYWPVISHCLGGVSRRVTNASSKAGPKDIPGYLGTCAHVYTRTRACTCVTTGLRCEPVTRRILVEPRLGSKTLPQITEPLSCPFVYWSILRGFVMELGKP